MSLHRLLQGALLTAWAAVLGASCSDRLLPSADGGDDGPFSQTDAVRRSEAGRDRRPSLADGLPFKHFICRDATESSPQGLLPAKKFTSQAGDWKLALGKAVSYGEVAISGAKAGQAAAVMDLVDPNAEVAGFIVSFNVGGGMVQDEVTSLLAALRDKPSFGWSIMLRAGGIVGKTHDLFDVVRGTELVLTLASPTDVSTLRNGLVARLLDRSIAQLGPMPVAYGSSHQQMVLRFSTVRRFGFKKDRSGQVVTDAAGYPLDSGDPLKRRLLVMGAVAGPGNHADHSRSTRLDVEDLSNGTALGQAQSLVESECDVIKVAYLPMADIIWVVEEPASTSGSSTKPLSAYANGFIGRGLSCGLDHRLGVTGVCDPQGAHASTVGKLCAKSSKDPQDQGGTDRFLLTSEQLIFEACLDNPPGYEAATKHGLVNAVEAVKRHLPREKSSPSRIRSGATLAIIAAADEIPASLSGLLTTKASRTACLLEAQTQAQVDQVVSPHLKLLSGLSSPQAPLLFFLLGGICHSPCDADVGHGYKELVHALGGQMGEACQKDLGATMEIIMDSIVGAASPLVPRHEPISSTMAVALDDVPLKRSHLNGYFFRAPTSSLVPVNVKFKIGSQVVVAYQRWRSATGK